MILSGHLPWFLVNVLRTAESGIGAENGATIFVGLYL